MSTGMDQLEVRRTLSGEVAVSGALAAESFHQFESAVSKPNEQRTTCVDLSACTFLDSSGVTALLRLNSRLAEDGDRLALVNPSRPCRRVIEICGLLDVFAIVERNHGEPATNQPARKSAN